MGYEVITVPIYIKSRTNPNLFVKSPVGQITLRTDRNTILGSVGDGYTPLQNGDMVKVLKPLIDKELIHITTGGTLRGGEDFWIQFKYNFSDPVIQEVYADKIIPYGTICNNHSGKRKGMLYDTDVEVVCMNTLLSAVYPLASIVSSLSILHLLMCGGLKPQGISGLVLQMYIVALRESIGANLRTPDLA